MQLKKPLKNKIRKIIEYNSMKNPYIWAKKSIFEKFPINLRYEIATTICGSMIK